MKKTVFETPRSLNLNRPELGILSIQKSYSEVDTAAEMEVAVGNSHMKPYHCDQLYFQ